MAMHTSKRIVIVGGGVAGLSIAARLAQAGLSVTVLETSRLGQGATTRNQGWLHSGAWFAPQQVELARLCYESLQKTLQFCPECVQADAAAMSYVFSQHETDPDRWTTAWEAAGIPFRSLEVGELFERYPGLAISQVRHAFQLPDRSLQTDLLLHRLAETAQKAGAEIRSATTVARLVQQGDSVQGVETSRGERILARLVILAGNASGGSLLPGYGAQAMGADGEEVALVVLKAHLVAARPNLSRWPLCVVDADGFNHLPHQPYSVFGNSRWLPARHGEDERPVAAEIQHLWNQVERFFPDFKRADYQTAQWAGATVQAMRLEQMQSAQLPLPMVIDHSRERDRIKNLLSVFPGRATLWAHLAEKTVQCVLEQFEMPQRDISRPVWGELIDAAASSR